MLSTSDCLEGFVGDLSGGLVFGKSIGIVQSIVCYRQRSRGRVRVLCIPTTSSAFSAIVGEFLSVGEQIALYRPQIYQLRSREIRNDVCIGGAYSGALGYQTLAGPGHPRHRRTTNWLGQSLTHSLDVSRVPPEHRSVPGVKIAIELLGCRM